MTDKHFSALTYYNRDQRWWAAQVRVWRFVVHATNCPPGFDEINGVEKVRRILGVRLSCWLSKNK